jgi:hypothetical protein
VGPLGVCSYYCEFSGSDNDYCSSCWVNFINFCSSILPLL